MASPKLAKYGIFGWVFLLATWSVYSGIPQELNRVTVANETGLPLTRLYWAPTYQGTRDSVWGPNVIALKRTLGYGGTLSFYIHYPDTCGLFDFLAFDNQGNGYSLTSFQICNREEGLILLQPIHRVPFDRLPRIEETALEFFNDGPTDIWFLFLSPQSFSLWGFDVLSDGSVLGPGDRVNLVLPYKMVAPANLPYDILAVDGRDQLFNARYEFIPGQASELKLSDLISR